jgi:hypothetical protein
VAYKLGCGRSQRCAYVSLNVTGIRQQSPHGTKAEGRMAYVGMLYYPQQLLAGLTDFSYYSVIRAELVRLDAHLLKHADI